MKFIDEVRIEVRSGDGAPGAVHFRREKYKPRMGPDGGDGGKGGDVYFKATLQMQSLLDFKFVSKYAAENGRPGMGADKNGRGGEDLVISVPVGTLIYDSESGDLLADLVEPEKEMLMLRGGKGGLGNRHFATSTRQAPEYAQPGLPGKSMRYRMELRLLADVALIGFPNAGKSSLITKLSAAKPKIGDYPFTTLVPNLGVVRGEQLDFVIADIPGIIEGAAEGKGLGHRFLRHAERTRVLLLLVDTDPYSGRQLDEELKILLEELKNYSESLAERPFSVSLSKMDLWFKSGEEPSLEKLMEIPELQEKGIEAFVKELESLGIRDKLLLFSSMNGVGLELLSRNLQEKLQQLGPREYKNHISSLVSYGNVELFQDGEEDEEAFVFPDGLSEEEDSDSNNEN